LAWKQFKIKEQKNEKQEIAVTKIHSDNSFIVVVGRMRPADQYKHLDTTQNLVEVRICHLTEFGLIGTQNNRVYLPLIIR